MVVKNQRFNYRYAADDARDLRSDEYKVIKYFNLVSLIVFLLSSVWIFMFIFRQADWEYNLKIDNSRAYAAVTTWKWWTITFVVLADILACVFLIIGVWPESRPMLLTLSVLSYLFSMFGIFNLYLRGSIVCFVFPFAIGTFSALQFFKQSSEDKEFEVSRDLRKRGQPPPTMETFLDDHEEQLRKF